MQSQCSVITCPQQHYESQRTLRGDALLLSGEDMPILRVRGVVQRTRQDISKINKEEGEGQI